MKRLLLLILTFILLQTATVAWGEGSYEGKGAAGPQALAQAYVQALNQGDAESLIRLFALESYVDNKHPEAYAPGYPFADSMICPVTDPYTRDLLVSEHYAEIADDWFRIWLYRCNPAQYESRTSIGISKNGKYGESPEAYLTDMRSSAAAQLPGSISLLAYEDDAAELMLMLYPTADLSAAQAHFAALQSMWGCDEVRSAGMILQLGQDTVFTAPTIARYGDSWFLMDFAGYYTRMLDSHHPFIPVQWEGQAAPADVLPFDTPSMEGNGFDSPQDAAIAYATAWQQGDIRAMLRCFAIESMVDHFDAEGYLNARSATSIMADPVRCVPVTDDLSRTTLIAVRYGSIARNMIKGHLWEGGLTDQSSIDSIMKPTEVRNAWNARSAEDWQSMTFDAPITEDCPELRALLGNEQTDALMDHEARTYVKGYAAFVNPEILGCEGLQEVWLPLSLNGEACLLTLTCAQYGDHWYIYSVGGYLYEVMRSRNLNTCWGLVHLQDGAHP